MATAPKAAPKSNPKVVPIDEAAEEASPPPKKSKKKLFLILAVFLLILGSGGAWFALDEGGGEPGAEPAVEAAKPPVYLAMEPFTVNLQPEIGEQYLQVAFTLQVADQSQVDQVKLYMPLVRSRLLLLLSSKKPSELASAEGKQKLQEQIIEQVREPFTPQGAPLGISGVFFTAFVIQ